MLPAGIDEAGRGCLAGPVVAAAVILDPARPLAGLADSKTLSPSRREKLAHTIKACARAWGIGLCWQKRIDEINILQATLEAMARAVVSLRIKPDLLLIDGLQRIPGILLEKKLEPLPDQQAIVGGDRKEPAISAASILAKTFRDRLMLCMDRKWPAYGFGQHKGYGTPGHLDALARLGPCPLHRLTFKRVRKDNAVLAPSNLAIYHLHSRSSAFST